MRWQRKWEQTGCGDGAWSSRGCLVALSAGHNRRHVQMATRSMRLAATLTLQQSVGEREAVAPFGIRDA